MNISEAGLELIKTHEGCELVAYPDPGTGGDPWTIGYGHTNSNVRQGMHITQEQADEFLRHDIQSAERCIANSVKVDLTQSQFDALCSLVFNIGCANFGRSTLLRKLNDGDDVGAADQFLVWNKAAGQVMRGLSVRREAERRMFLA